LAGYQEASKRQKTDAPLRGRLLSPLAVESSMTLHAECHQVAPFEP
jgi:hypothetical protein